ncbi:MAG: class A beta-lactamase, subclass A2 [Chryseobacterium sp.]|nr:class A beta-lactamase, subclass A2 [Chryseobacterium sp.]
MKIIVFLFLLIFTASCAQNKHNLEAQINKISEGQNAIVAVSVLGIEKPFVLNIKGNEHLPMQSIFKFHIALAVLNLVDERKLNLNQKILIKKTDLLENTWSPIREKHPNGNVELTVGEIIKFTVAESDNNGCDLLLKLIGGTKTVQNFMNKKSVKDFQIKYNEKECHEILDLQYENYSSTNSIVGLLKDFQEGKIVSESSTNFLIKIMAETSTGANRLSGQLPKNILAHKTGTSFTVEGLTAATNDMGIVTLPNGNHYAICVFVSNSKEIEKVNCKIIADVSKLIYDYLLDKK